MTLIKNFPEWNNWSDLFDDKLFKSRFKDDWAPAINIIENEDDYEIEVAAPGMRREDFHVIVENGVLNITGKTEKEKEEKRKNYARKEFSSASFSRKFTLPQDVDEEIEATYRDGILDLKIVKLNHNLTPKKEIEIK